MKCSKMTKNWQVKRKRMKLQSNRSKTSYLSWKIEPPNSHTANKQKVQGSIPGSLTLDPSDFTTQSFQSSRKKEQEHRGRKNHSEKKKSLKIIQHNKWKDITQRQISVKFRSLEIRERSNNLQSQKNRSQTKERKSERHWNSQHKHWDIDNGTMSVIL